ncbi:MAG: TIGR03936 family radical SAM-associated protein, partial [Candidatus Aminicenantales bacterium]
VEVERGCPQKCRFCQASTIYFPPRKRNPNRVVSSLLNSLQLTGYEDSSLTSLSVGDYPFLDDVVKVLMGYLEREKVSLSLSSLRPRCLSSEISRSIVKVRKTGFTIVPEAGTERLRTVINKRLDDNEIWEAAKIAFSSGWRLLKLYFMIGLPSEEEEDLEGIVRIIKEIIRIGYRILKSAPLINLSIASFIPKPHTPFQWLKMEEERILREKHRYLKLQLRKYPFVRFKEHSVHSSILEAVFSRGDRRLNQVLYQAWKHGAGFDSWKDHFRFQSWTKAFDLEKIDYHLYLQALSQDQVLPWDHIDPGLKKSWLQQELQRALRGETTNPCPERSCKECQGCSYPFFWKKTPLNKVIIPPQIYSFFGRETKKIIRYRVFYEKKEMARFLSHQDLIHILQRSLRRARIQIVHSKGFHPKMAVSYLPALPLGMAGKEEVFEFKSNYDMAAEGILKRINNFLPSGIRILKVEKIKDNEPSLSKEIEGFVYSLDLNNPEIKNTIHHKFNRQGLDSWPPKLKMLEQRLKAFLQESTKNLLSSINLEIQGNKLFLKLHYLAQPGLRPQEILSNILGIKNPVFFMSREKVLFKKKGSPKISEIDIH